MGVKTQVCKVGLVCDGRTPRPLTDFHYLKRYGRHDYGCKACRNYQQKLRRKLGAYRPPPKHALYYKGFSVLAHAFCFPRKPLKVDD